MIASLIGWIVVGAILGALARLLVPGPDPMSVPATIGLGIAGQFVAGLIFYGLFGVGAGWIAGLIITIGLLLISRRTGIGRRSGARSRF
ncbi:GlsB/YeaQ/YmgE family stress response membrane protein [Acidiferrimicrobium sp. IK]|uniref:GlsB/YeaQ/YmgE family stress response membrane protein n=1 Tax=Acidiferrimicrobium sp. IK TaxID=2871700 RepID=UPI0021CB591D|nr:GlsB/YeaQ/YmgE family stress response membrane protein [Acidiferrimicrobium sp. IK]MCU4183575.1 GlsB/YeaQ/YmgE family stress response membrane protein [Acidiferrimicrobium sp. IK]